MLGLRLFRTDEYGPVEITTKPRQYEITADLAAQINTELTNYYRHRNALSLWNVLAICIENKIPIPDMQIEYETRDGDSGRVNLELVTEHYRGRSVAEKVRAGFSLYTPRGEGDKLRRVLDQQELTAEILSL